MRTFDATRSRKRLSIVVVVVFLAICTTSIWVVGSFNSTHGSSSYYEHHFSDLEYDTFNQLVRVGVRPENFGLYPDLMKLEECDSYSRILVLRDPGRPHFCPIVGCRAHFIRGCYGDTNTRGFQFVW